MSLAFVFPGQGSQFVGMGKELAAAYPEARAVFDQADHALGFSLSALCFNGPEADLTDTLNAQPALLTHSIATLHVLQKISPDRSPAFVAGHSLGEFSALVACGALEFGDTVKLVRERGRVMKLAGEINPGAMAAVIGMDAAVLAQVCDEAGAQIANLNEPAQTVITGTKDSIEKAGELAKARGAKRVIPLRVSIASHSRLMQDAAREFEKAVHATPVSSPRIPIIANVTAQPLQNADEIRQEMVKQLTSSVLWVNSIQYLAAQDVTHFIEVGPKDVLAGLIRRIDSNLRAVSVGDPASVEAFVEK
ncbi:MAG: ACP S-malonyltransferase [Chloroflexi bacterium]|nr:ACP S-malonyltransferase [Chloroflexota bacterium]